MSKQCLVQNFEIISTSRIGFLSKGLIWQDNKRLVLRIYCISLVPLNMMNHKYFNPTPNGPYITWSLKVFQHISCLWCLTKSLPEESCDFQFPKKKRDLSGLDFDKPSKSGEQILFKSNLFETFVKSNILWLSGAKINFALTFLVLQLFELPLIVVRYYWDLDLIMRQIPWCSNLIFLWRIVFCCYSDSEFPPVLI